jgi:glutamate N-acetyltransferase/amino-acid N-acetyltransferase
MTDVPLDFVPVPGVRLSTTAAGIKRWERDDLTLIELAPGGTAAAVFTRNAFCAAPVTLARHHLIRTAPRYLLINAGNANAGTGAQGLRDALACCEALAGVTGCATEQVLPFSTGVIGEPLPVVRIIDALPRALAGLSEQGWADAARAIMTTDTVPKLVSRRFVADGHSATVTGIAKGAGMICPDMATLLAYLATDLAVSPEALQAILGRAVAPSFNAVTVDGDTSTNDACVLLASGAAPLAPVTKLDSRVGQALAQTVSEVCRDLASAIVRDGEGATKLVSIDVVGARDCEEARRVAYTIAHSPLVKTALFASDPNWGRILAAVGRSGIENLDIDRVTIHLDDLCIVRDGGRAPDYTERAGGQVLARKEFAIRVGLGRGEVAARVLTCDLSYDYVRINAEYRT